MNDLRWEEGSNLSIKTVTNSFLYFSATDGKIHVEDIVRLGSKIEDANTSKAGER